MYSSLCIMIPWINTPCVCMNYMFRLIVAIIRYTELFQSPFRPSICYTSLQCLQFGRALYLPSNLNFVLKPDARCGEGQIFCVPTPPFGAPGDINRATFCQDISSVSLDKWNVSETASASIITLSTLNTYQDLPIDVRLLQP
jgi:hypothetical protein